MGKGDKIGDILAGQFDLSAELFVLLHGDHRAGAAPHAGSKIKRIHGFRHIGGVERRADIAANAVYGMAGDTAFLQKNRTATL